jgi:hypothetical protein
MILHGTTDESGIMIKIMTDFVVNKQSFSVSEKLPTLKK